MGLLVGQPRLYAVWARFYFIVFAVPPFRLVGFSAFTNFAFVFFGSEVRDRQCLRVSPNKVGSAADEIWWRDPHHINSVSAHRTLVRGKPWGNPQLPIKGFTQSSEIFEGAPVSLPIP